MLHRLRNPAFTLRAHCFTAMAGEAQFVEFDSAFTYEETAQIRTDFDTTIPAGNIQSFTCVPEDNAKWLYDRMISLAIQADQQAGWGLLNPNTAAYTDQMIYDRFGPQFSDPEFKWHVDAQ